MDTLSSKGIKLQQYEGVGEDIPASVKKSEEACDHATKNAAQRGVCTLCTPSFGRGSDFVTHDELLDKAGGLHVIQTFAADFVADEVQIQGRTARQGKNGSWSLMLDNAELAKMDPNTWKESEEPDLNEPATSALLNVSTMQTMSATSRFAQLQTAREKCERALAVRLAESHKNAFEKDAATRAFFNLLTGKSPADQNKALSAYEAWYSEMLKAEFPDCLMHSVFVLDESGSMEGSRWKGLMSAYRKYITTVKDLCRFNDLLSVVQFNGGARVTQKIKRCETISQDLTMQGGGTLFPLGLCRAADVLFEGLGAHPECTKYTLIWMTDGCASLDGLHEAFKKYISFGENLTAFFMFFGQGPCGKEIVQQVRGQFQVACPKSSAFFAEAVDAAKLEELFGYIATRRGDNLSFT